MNTASTAGLFPYGYDRLPYTTTKHAIVGLSESLAVYLRPRGIGVSCFCPAGVMTNIVEQITFYGEPEPPRGPNFGVIDADAAGELVAEGRQPPGDSSCSPPTRRATSCGNAATTSRPTSTRIVKDYT